MRSIGCWRSRSLPLWLPVLLGALLAVLAVPHGYAQPAQTAAPPASPNAANSPLTVLTTSYVRPGCEARFEAALRDTLKEDSTIAGHPSIEFLRPDNPNNQAYTVIARFDRPGDYLQWLDSPQRAAFIKRMTPMIDGPPQYRTRSHPPLSRHNALI
jgi:heme-degrading monooxygenase HmoA